MICKTQIQAQKVAEAGAKKMDAQDYTIKNSGFARLYNVQFRVSKPGQDRPYVVSLDPAKTFCTCEFFKANKQFGTCKHIVKCREEVEENLRADRMTEEERQKEEYRFDADPFH